MFKGSMVALVTPMHANGSIDQQSFHDLIEWHIAAKTNALIIAGTTGESATLSQEEQTDLIQSAVEISGKRIPIIAGTGSNSTQHALELTQLAEEKGADAALIVTPYYNKPPQNGLYEHYKFIAEKTTLPIILYNVPGRTACDMTVDTVARLAKIPSIIGIKEATGQVGRTTDIVAACPQNFYVYSGDDAANFELMKNGAHGVISVTANIVPRKMHEFCEAALAKNFTLAEQCHNAMLPLHKGLFVEANPIPVKWALHEMGKIPAGIRLPLLPLESKYHAELRQILQNIDILNEKINS
ncbi:MAG TPA: 4-hydroxy-tetrahydrodipicolinate synthase [Gammaproteobacteria bacterium]|jgi:4-hydroxy-tetrahydrodipicolinate synthase|nr:4-hydroxy-tetrahydrodipicolinate synthase [Gammaproteobacteria bacterium]